MKTKYAPETLTMLSILQENLGFLVTVTLFVLIRKRKLLQKRSLHIFGPIFRQLRSIISSSLICGPNDQDVFHITRRLLGLDFVVVRSPVVAASIRDCIQHFENTGFVSRVYQFARQLAGAADPKSPTDIECILQHELNGQSVKTTTAKRVVPKTKNSLKATRIQRAYFEFDIEAHSQRSALDELPQPESTKNARSRTKTEIHSSTTIQNNESLLATAFPLLKSCVKELVVLLEAKSNRKNIVDLGEYCRRHCVNIVGVCVFGRPINELTGSASKFYEHFDRLYELWLRHEKATPLRSRAAAALRWLGWRRRRAGNEPDGREKAFWYFKNLIENCFEHHGMSDGHESCLASSVAKRAAERSSGVQRNERIELTTTFVIAFSINVMETMAGAMSLILHELSVNVELQEKIRNKDPVKFDLEGIPCLDLDFVMQPLYIDSLIAETLRKHPIDPLIQLTCKVPYRIPESNARINPKCAVLIPVHVLQTDNNLYPGADTFDSNVHHEMEEEHGFITDSEIRSFSIFVDQFIEMCLKASITSVIQEYEFKADAELDNENVTSCRFSMLPQKLPSRVSRMEKRGKVVILEASLKAFYASKETPFLSKIGL